MFCSTCGGSGRLNNGRYNNWCMGCGGTGQAADERRYKDPSMHFYHGDKYMEGENKVCVHCGLSRDSHATNSIN